MIYNVAILGLGEIVSRHLIALKSNAKHFNIVGIYDPKIELTNKYQVELDCKVYNSEDEAYEDQEVNCIIILTPSDLHYKQAIKALNYNKNIILEKPAVFSIKELDEIIMLADTRDCNIFTILQVRLTPEILIAKELLSQNLLGDIIGASLVQRWQRPITYFNNWRGSMSGSGGILSEFAIHYLDILQLLLGSPTPIAATFYNNKFYNTDVADSIYALLDFNKKFAATVEVTVACEPRNIECTLLIRGTNGFLRLGGKSLNQIVELEFLDNHDENLIKVEEITQDVHNKLDFNTLVARGASPYHPQLYYQIIHNPSQFDIKETYNVIKLIEEIYSLQQ